MEKNKTVIKVRMIAPPYITIFTRLALVSHRLLELLSYH